MELMQMRNELGNAVTGMEPRENEHNITVQPGVISGGGDRRLDDSIKPA
jgi:hypothetical protein